MGLNWDECLYPQSLSKFISLQNPPKNIYNVVIWCSAAMIWQKLASFGSIFRRKSWFWVRFFGSSFQYEAGLNLIVKTDNMNIGACCMHHTVKTS